MPSKSSPAFFGFTPATKHARPLAYARLICVWNWPVLPVMPCVITRVFLSIRMLNRFSLLGVSLFLKPTPRSQARFPPLQGGGPVDLPCSRSFLLLPLLCFLCRFGFLL